jgi:hypothetical protein
MLVREPAAIDGVVAKAIVAGSQTELAVPLHASSTTKFGNPGASPSVSADGRKNGIVLVFFGLIANAIEGVSLLAHLAPLLLLGGGHYLSAFTAEQLQAAAYLSIQFFEHGFAISLVFFGFDCLVMA